MSTYYFGHAPAELERLVDQAVFLRPFTERLLLSAGLLRGMRVLDVGCGAGDVAMLVADLVGPQGEVVGIDRAEAAISLAEARAADGGRTNVTFKHVDISNYRTDKPFDLVVGRYVLVHCDRPAQIVRAAAENLRPGGTMAFHEVDGLTSFSSCPSVPLFETAVAEMMASIRAAVPHLDVPAKIVGIFREAGLPAPDVLCERPAAGREPLPFCRWVAGTVAKARAHRDPSSLSFDITHFAIELRDAVVAADSQLVGCDQWLAWSRI